MQDFRDKTAFVTGGVSGIGLGIAKTFVAAGMRVAISYRRQDHLDAALAHFTERGTRERVHPIKLDVTDREAMASAADEAERVFGKVHILVNNAGISVFGPADEATYDDYDWIMGVNFGGVVNGLVSFIPRIKAHGEGGHIVNVASMASFLPGPQAGLYTASKFAVRGLTECLRDNLMPYGIGVSLMTPALVKTNAYESALGRPQKYSDTRSTVTRAETDAMKPIFDVGMDPLEVGEKTLRGIRRNDLYIITHPENKDEAKELCDAILAAFPDEPVDPRREAVEVMRRQAKLDARMRRMDTSDLLPKEQD